MYIYIYVTKFHFMCLEAQRQAGFIPFFPYTILPSQGRVHEANCIATVEQPPRCKREAQQDSFHRMQIGGIRVAQLGRWVGQSSYHHSTCHIRGHVTKFHFMCLEAQRQAGFIPFFPYTILPSQGRVHEANCIATVEQPPRCKREAQQDSFHRMQIGGIHL